MVVDGDRFCFDDKAFKVGADGCTSDEGDLVAWSLFEDIDFFGKNYFDIGDFVSVFGLFVINDDFVADDDIVKEGEDIFEAAWVPGKVGTVAGNDGVAALAGEAGAGIMNDAVLKGFLHFAFERAEVAFDQAFAADANDGDVLVDAWDDEAIFEWSDFEV